MFSEPITLLKQAFQVAVEAAHPTRHLTQHLPEPPAGRLVVVGAGKAAAAMAQAVEAHYQGLALEGLVVTRYGHALPTAQVAVKEAAHPVPDAAGVAATREILQLASGLREDDLLLCLISGGGSALLCAPRGITLADKAQLTQELLASGADIKEMNTVRKHLSEVKGGWLAKRAAPARVISLILSDVVGDDLSSIASGPTAPDPTTFAEALELARSYQLRQPAALAQLEQGARGGLEETPKPDDPCFARVDNRLIASAQQSLQAVKRFLEGQGIAAHILSSSVEGEAREVAKVHAAIAQQIARYGEPFARPCALISGGETTVTLRAGEGKGGRNSEFALALALALDSSGDIYALAADTDGVDGSEDNAGVIVTPETLRDRRSLAKAHLAQHDSYSFFAQVGGLLGTGPTNTNVNDLRVILIR
jgi:hydroxypyruvate reductase